MFPARAGMSRNHPASSPMADDVPRASGDEPVELHVSTVKEACSPRERG